MGIADYGVSSYTTTSFLAILKDSTIESSNNSLPDPAAMSYQLNVNLGFTSGGHWYDYWIQDVAQVDTDGLGGTLALVEDNVWNFSSPGECLSSTGVEGNGTVTTYSGCIGYYATGVAPYAQLGYSSGLELMVNASVTSKGQPTVKFLYNDGSTWTAYDDATFPWATKLTGGPDFVVNGSADNPTGYLYYDAEFVGGGPCCGYHTSLTGGGSVYLGLEYWNGYNFESVSHASNYGYDTAEELTNASSSEAYDADGSLYAELASNTSDPDLKSVLWSPSTIALVRVDGPGTSDATLDFDRTPTPYDDGYGEFAVAPVTLYFNVTCSGYTQGFGKYALSAGSVTTLETGTWTDLQIVQGGLPTADTWGAAISTDTQTGPASAPLVFYLPVGSYQYRVAVVSGYLPDPSVGDATVNDPPASSLVTVVWQVVQIASNSTEDRLDVGQETNLSTPLVNISGDTLTWTGLPKGCSSVNATYAGCTPSVPGNYSVGLTVVDPYYYTTSSETLLLTVFADPSVSSLTAAPASADVGQIVEFSTSFTPGAGSDRVSWTGLPSGCSSANSSSIACTLTASGPLSVGVSVTDASGFVAKASLGFTADLPPSVSLVVVSPEGSILEGQSLTFQATATDGSGDPVYAWTGLPPGCSSADSPTLSCTPTASGSWWVELTVSDSNHGFGTSQAVNIVVRPSLFGLPALEGYAILGGVVAAGAAVVSLIAVRTARRKHAKEPKPADGSDGPPIRAA